MRFSRMIHTVGVNSEGAHNEVIVGGVIDVPGRTMFEKARHLEKHGDSLRQFLLHEPRGKVIQCTNLVLPSSHPEAQAGYIIMESASYPPMSGTNTISTVTALLETGMIPMTEPETIATLEAPGGLIRVKAECRDGKCRNVTFDNVPCFVFGLDLPVDVPGIGKLMVDVAYGGMIYVLVDAAALGFAIKPDEARRLVDVGEQIKAAAAVQIEAVHPANPDIHTINQTLWAGPIARDAKGRPTSRNAVIVSPGRIDRSPCGTGTSARLAVMHARGQIQTGEEFIHESIIDTKFTGVIRGTGTVGNVPSIESTITGRAWITGFHQYVIDPSDPLPTGYRLSDTWPLDQMKAAGAFTVG
jgi:proline racemase